MTIAHACDLICICVGISRRNSFKGGKNLKPGKISHFQKKKNGKIIIIIIIAIMVQGSLENSLNLG